MKRRNNIAIELTPLLDVILIILFMIITENNAEKERVTSEAAAAYEKLAAQNEQLESSLEDTRTQLSEAGYIITGYQSFEEYSVIISVGISRQKDDSRLISIYSEGIASEVSYGWDSLRYGRNALRTELSKLIPSDRETRPVFITFTYSADDIYQQDYELVTDVLGSLADENIYITEARP